MIKIWSTYIRIISLKLNEAANGVNDVRSLYFVFICIFAKFSIFRIEFEFEFNLICNKIYPIVFLREYFLRLYIRKTIYTSKMSPATRNIEIRSTRSSIFLTG